MSLHMLHFTLGLCVILRSVMISVGDMEGFIVGGQHASIRKYPHSAFMTVNCAQNGEVFYWVCGASVLTRQLLLSAGHCVDPCDSPGTKIQINLGSEHRDMGVKRMGYSFVLHEKYDTSTNEFDIAIVKMFRPVELSVNIRRVAVMKNPPYHEQAILAGWGDVNEVTEEQAFSLIEVDQKLWRFDICLKLFRSMPDGTFCGSSDRQMSYAAAGDSGSALVVRGYIQIGLVSFKIPAVAVNVIIYTDVGYHYYWITLNARRLQCNY